MTELAPAEEKRPGLLESLAGSYFVSTYPPFSSWSKDELPAFKDRLLSPASSSTPLGLYCHIPFCDKRCAFCYYLSYADQRDRIDAFLAALAGEIAIYADQPALAGRSPAYVYFGGGTPSLLSAPQIDRLLTNIKREFPWDAVQEVSFECAPRSVTVDKVRVLRDAGVTRISMGVQSFDDEVLQRSGRIHRIADVESAWKIVDQMDFPVVNIDLMVGLVGETDASFQQSIQRVLELGPESVTLYQLEIPLNTPLYRSLDEGSCRLPLPSWSAKRARLAEGFSVLEKAGYSVRSAYSAVRDPVAHRFVYQEAQYRGSDLLGLGPSSFSYLDGVHHQNIADLDRYMDRLTRDQLPLGRAHSLSEEEQVVRELVLQLKLGGCSATYFRDKFRIDIGKRFEQPLRELANRGWLALTEQGVEVTRAGLLRVDELLPHFYLPRHRSIRYS